MNGHMTKTMCSVNMATSKDLVLTVSAAAGAVAGILFQESNMASNAEDDDQQ